MNVQLPDDLMISVDLLMFSVLLMSNHVLYDMVAHWRREPL